MCQVTEHVRDKAEMGTGTSELPAPLDTKQTRLVPEPSAEKRRLMKQEGKLSSVF